MTLLRSRPAALRRDPCPDSLPSPGTPGVGGNHQAPSRPAWQLPSDRHVDVNNHLTRCKPAVDRPRRGCVPPSR
jgi:hypothetical protein